MWNSKLFNTRTRRFSLARLANIFLNSESALEKSGAKEEWLASVARRKIGRSSGGAASRYSRRRAFWYGFLPRYVKDWRLTPASSVTVSLETRCVWTNGDTVSYYISSGRYPTAGFSTGAAAVTSTDTCEAVSGASVFCRSPLPKDKRLPVL